MSLTRRNVLRLIGGAVPSEVTLPRPFTIPLPVPSVLRPARSDATTDYYEVTEKLGEAEILPGHTTKIWGYCVTFPWPMLETHSRGSAGQAISLRQAAVTADILGRTNAGYRFTVTGIARDRRPDRRCARRPDRATRHHDCRRTRHPCRHVLRYPIAESQVARSL
jgi:hypothetical protein